MNPILGVDIAKDKFDCCLLINGQVLTKVFANSPGGFKLLGKWLEKNGALAAGLRACMEATGIYGDALLSWLFAGGIVVARVNPAQIKRYGQSLLARNKTDRLDAFIIAEFARERFASGRLRAWTPPSPEQARLRALTRLLGARKEQLGDEARRAKVIDASLRSHTRSLQRFLEKQIAALEEEIAELIENAAELKARHDLLRTIPSVGPVTAQIVLAKLPEDIQNARAASAYAGVAPQRHESGRRNGPGRMSKTGNPHLRHAMYMPALSGRKTNPRLKALSERLAQKGHAPKQAVGACMHLLLRLCVGVLKSGQAFQPDWKKQPAPSQ